MKCSNPDCDHGIGLVAHRRGWFSEARYCSKHCREAIAAHEPNLQQGRNATAFIYMLLIATVICLTPVEAQSTQPYHHVSTAHHR